MGDGFGQGFGFGCGLLTFVLFLFLVCSGVLGFVVYSAYLVPH